MIAGVVVGLATAPLTPLAVLTDTLVTVPPDIGAHTGNNPAETVNT